MAVQRAYADWRRYPQYIVPLSESSIDLIFAPAFGSSKKNATDIRLAIDAIELVFTRPEIGTFILLSGDSDFSTMVIKLKEYGKYVIGVGIRESRQRPADPELRRVLLVQRPGRAHQGSRHAVDPARSVGAGAARRCAQMARNGDVMRSDRLKQVMQQIDPNFDERNAGFNRFSKFVLEAGQKGLVQVTKLDNGQYEVAPIAGPRGRRGRPAPQVLRAREAREPSAKRAVAGGGAGRGRGPRGARESARTRRDTRGPG